ncbi:hypothetical protein U9M48_005362 [Paspalum notatum var. saurae]|uniref:PGG domain-containing protein n=1 Tax=Paspalum notatum var. saurae TaxID=547442 RepID=A0AAQ3SLS9_PASNO
MPTMDPAEAKSADAKMVVATGHDECQKLKDLVQQQDHPTTRMLVVMASGEQQASAEEKPPRASMHPLLAAAACRGNLEELRFLLNREQKHSSVNLSQGFVDQAKAYKIINDGGTALATTTAGRQQATANNSDVEQGGGIDAVVPLVEGVTVEGDTVLHLVAANGEEDNFLGCAAFIHGLEGGGLLLLSKENHNGDTPLHCAARAGRTKMVSCLLTLAQGTGIILEQLLRKVNNRKETALHEAVRIGDNHMVAELLSADRGLASFPEGNTHASPLYLAIALGRGQIAKTLHHDENGNRRPLSYSGPDGQNALHAAVLRGPGTCVPTHILGNYLLRMYVFGLISLTERVLQLAELTRMVLEWNTNKDLITERDKNGSTPLHFAANLLKGGFLRDRRGHVFSQVLEANTGAVYQPDNEGSYPIHVAASAGAKYAIELIVEKCGGTGAGLRDAKGRTFLHVAVVEEKVWTVYYTCMNRSLAWIMNMQDNDGNTALHLAVQTGSLRIFSALVGNRHVNLNLANMEGETALDIAHYKVSPEFPYNQDSEATIRWALLQVGALWGTYHRDHFKEKYEQIHGRSTEREKKHLENVKEKTQTLCIGSVLIATVTFGATFALPGGYRADDHTNGGTPTLAGWYAFDAFVVVNTLAFTLSSAATVLLIRAGSPSYNTRNRNRYSTIAYALVDFSVAALVADFALAVFAVLAPVAPGTTTIACVISINSVVPCSHASAWLKWVILARPFWVRSRALRSLLLGLKLLLASFLPFAYIFYWAWIAETGNMPNYILAPAPAPSS